MSALTVTKERFESEIINSSKPVLLQFFATWCGPCRMLSPIVDQIAQERTDIVVAKVDIDKEEELTERFDVMTVPAIFVIKDGEVVNQSAGVLPKDAILRMIQP